MVPSVRRHSDDITMVIWINERVAGDITMEPSPKRHNDDITMAIRIHEICTSDIIMVPSPRRHNDDITMVIRMNWRCTSDIIMVPSPRRHNDDITMTIRNGRCTSDIIIVQWRHHYGDMKEWQNKCMKEWMIWEWYWGEKRRNEKFIPRSTHATRFKTFSMKMSQIDLAHFGRRLWVPIFTTILRLSTYKHAMSFSDHTMLWNHQTSRHSWHIGLSFSWALIQHWVGSIHTRNKAMQ